MQVLMNRLAETLDPTTTLAHLATAVAGAARVFARHGLDFCCAGARSLDAACQAKGLDPRSVLREIEAQAPRAEDFERWDRRPLPALIDHLLLQYHARHRADLPRLLDMAAKVEAAHAGRTDCPRGLHAHLCEFAEALDGHMQKEEQVLFPLILDGRGALAQMPIQVMEMEHDDHARNLQHTRALTRDLTLPADACATWGALYAGLVELEAELMKHVHLENHVLFPRAIHEAKQA